MDLVPFDLFEFDIMDTRCKFVVVPNFMITDSSYTHTHTNHEIFYVWDGEIEIEADNQKYLLTNGHAIFIPATQYHQSVTKEGTKKINFYFSFHDSRNKTNSPEENAFQNAFNFSDIVQIQSTSIEKYLELFIEEYTSDNIGKKERVQSALCLLFYELYKEFSELNTQTHPPTPTVKNGNHYRYEIDSILGQYYNTDIDLAVLSEALHLSPKRVSVIIKTLYGKTFRDVRTEMRIHVAKQMLKNSNLSIQEIAKSVGFNSTRGFLSAFSNLMKMTPTEYKKQKMENASN